MKVFNQTVLVLIVLVSQQACHWFPQGKTPTSEYSTAPQRDLWMKRLTAESGAGAAATFHPLGHLLVSTGRFLIPTPTTADVQTWLNGHRDMLGVPPNAELVLRKPSEVTETNPDNPVLASIFDVKVKGVPFSGLPIRVRVDRSDSAILSIANGFAPPLRDFGGLGSISEEHAWKIAEQHHGSPIKHEASEQTWFDKEWAFHRTPGVNELHWRLEGMDSDGNLQRFLIRAQDGAVSYATPTKTAFAVHQTHSDDAGHVLWDSQSLPMGCTPGSAGCGGTALTESEVSRDVLPAVVDLWYRLSSSNLNYYFQWPFTGLNRSPFDNGGNAVRAVVAHDGTTCSIACRSFGRYYFPSGSLVMHQYGLFGHEYGHGLLSRMKLIHPGTVGGNFSPPAQFTEAMADLIGIVSNYTIRLERFRVGSRFAIGEVIWRQTNNGWEYTLPPVSWEQKPGSCPADARARIGHAFYKAWDSFRYDMAVSDPRTAQHAEAFRAWWLVILTAFADLPDFPSLRDLYAALKSHSDTFYEKPTPIRYEVFAQRALLNQLKGLVETEGCS